MARARKWFSIIIAPHDRADSWKLRAPGWVLWVVAGLCVVGVAAPVGLGILYRHCRAQSQLAEMLRVENENLREENRRIAALENELVALGRFQRMIREWVGLPADSLLAAYAREPYLEPSFVGLPIVYGGAPGGGEWRWPANGWISRGFRAASEKDPGHFGIDIVAAKDERVRAAQAGRVRFCGWDDRLGNLVIVEHGDGYVSWYGHNSEFLVSEGDSVSRGQDIGVIGSTGVSSAPHLHFEIRKDGEPVDPMTLLTE